MRAFKGDKARGTAKGITVEGSAARIKRRLAPGRGLEPR